MTCQCIPVNIFHYFLSDLIDGNVKSVLNLCRNVKSQFMVSSCQVTT